MSSSPPFVASFPLLRMRIPVTRAQSPVLVALLNGSPVRRAVIKSYAASCDVFARNGAALPRDV